MEQPTPLNKTLEVEFYPSIEDFIYIATSVTNAMPAKGWSVNLYYLFLLVNAIGFPAYLWINNLFIPGTIVFLLNIIAVYFLTVRINADSYRNYYEHFHKNCVNEVARVQISAAGLRYASDGAESFWPWKRINRIEEGKDSIYFYCEGNGFAVRRNGFAYKDDEREFIDFANRMITTKDAKPIELQ